MNENYNNMMEDFELFVGEKKAEYYTTRFEMFMDQDAKAGWNWPALFVPTLWMAYRKMYLQSIAYLVITIIISLLAMKIAFIGYFNFVIGFGFPIIANYVYYLHAKSKIEKSYEINDSDEREVFIKKAGGTNVTAIFIMIIVSLAVQLFELHLTGNLEILKSMFL